MSYFLIDHPSCIVLHVFWILCTEREMVSSLGRVFVCLGQHRFPICLILSTFTDVNVCFSHSVIIISLISVSLTSQYSSSGQSPCLLTLRLRCLLEYLVHYWHLIMTLDIARRKIMSFGKTYIKSWTLYTQVFCKICYTDWLARIESVKRSFCNLRQFFKALFTS